MLQKCGHTNKGGDGSSLVIVEALISFKTFVNVSKLAKSNNLTVLERKTLPAASIPFDVLTSMNGGVNILLKIENYSEIEKKKIII